MLGQELPVREQAHTGTREAVETYAHLLSILQLAVQSGIADANRR